MKAKSRDQVLRTKPPEFLQASREIARPRAPLRSPSPSDRYRRPAISLESSGLWHDEDVNPYVDFGCFLTDQGGFIFSYKDVDPRFRWTLWRLFAWSAATGAEAWYLLHQSSIHASLVVHGLILACAFANLLVVRSPIAIKRTIEVRPDCMIVHNTDLFWRRYMDAGWPRFAPDAKGNKVVTGTYGTRHVEFFTVLRFDEFDRSPEVLEQHMLRAMQQLWASADLR